MPNEPYWRLTSSVPFSTSTIKAACLSSTPSSFLHVPFSFSVFFFRPAPSNVVENYQHHSNQTSSTSLSLTTRWHTTLVYVYIVFQHYSMYANMHSPASYTHTRSPTNKGYRRRKRNQQAYPDRFGHRISWLTTGWWHWESRCTAPCSG